MTKLYTFHIVILLTIIVYVSRLVQHNIWCSKILFNCSSPYTLHRLYVSM